MVGRRLADEVFLNDWRRAPFQAQTGEAAAGHVYTVSRVTPCRRRGDVSLQDCLQWADKTSCGGSGERRLLYGDVAVGHGLTVRDDSIGSCAVPTA